MALANRPDPLSVRNLRTPILTKYLESADLKAELMAVANEIKVRYISKVPKESGKLAQTVRVRPHKVPDAFGRRWNVDVTIGGIMGVDYADDVEARYGVLASVLREMGYKTGDYVRGPTGRGAKEAPSKPAGTSRDEKLAQLRANPDPEVQKYVDRVERFRAVRFRSNDRYKLDSESAFTDYIKLRKSTMAVQAKLGNDAAAEGYSALRDFRGARIMSGLTGYPYENRSRPELTQELMNERTGEMGGVTWEMRQMGIESPYDRGEPDPLSNYFSADELRYYGRSGDE